MKQFGEFILLSYACTFSLLFETNDIHVKYAIVAHLIMACSEVLWLLWNGQIQLWI